MSDDDITGPADGDLGPTDPRWEAVHRFLDGLSPLPERREVERWMDDDLSVQRYIKAHKKVWAMIGRRIGPNPIDPEDAWESIQDRVAEHDRRERFSLPGRGLEHLRVIDGGLVAGAPARLRLPWRPILASAAVLLIGATYLVARIVSRSPVTVSYMTMRGETPHEERLPDGVRMVLAPDSRLAFMIDPSGQHVAMLVGEASFTVAHRSDRVFVVRAGDIETRDLGTEFDVRAYRGMAPSVAVRHGRVSVRALDGRTIDGSTSDGSTIVDSGRVVRVDVASHIVRTSAAEDEYFAWTIGRYTFSDAPLQEVADALGRAYGLDVEIPDRALAAHIVTITVSSAGTADSAFDRVAQAVAGLVVARDGPRVRLFRP